MNFAQFLKTPFLQNTSRRLLLKRAKTESSNKSGRNKELHYITKAMQLNGFSKITKKAIPETLRYQ